MTVNDPATINVKYISKLNYDQLFHELSTAKVDFIIIINIIKDTY